MGVNVWNLQLNVTIMSQGICMKKVVLSIEGIREKSMLIEGNLVDEYYMAKIL